MNEHGTTLQLLRSRWLEVLDELERSHRTAWLALFDARLAALNGSVVTLDFSDRDKFAGAHTFDVATRPDYLDALAAAVSTRLGLNVTFTVARIARDEQ